MPVSDHLGSALTIGSYGGSFIYLGVTLAQMRACGGYKAWREGGFGATKADSERHMEELLEHREQEEATRFAWHDEEHDREDGYNGA